MGPPRRKRAPCGVCGDLSTGFHYSVPSCNGCRSFFRRTVIKKRVFKCRSLGNCLVNKAARCMCRSCRYKACVRIGMNSNAIQSLETVVDSASLLIEEVVLDDPSSSSTPPPPSATRRKEIVSQMEAVEEAMVLLRQSTRTQSFTLLDVLSKPSALLTAKKLSGSVMSLFVSLEVEAYAVLEFIKSFTWFCNLGFSEKCALLVERAFPILALRLAWNQAGSAFQDQVSHFLRPLIEKIRSLDVDQISMSILCALLLSNKVLASKEEMDSFAPTLVSYLTQRSIEASLVSQYFFLLWTSVLVGCRLHTFIKNTLSEDSLCRQIIDLTD